MNQAIAERLSRRTFTGVPFSSSEKDSILQLVEKANTEAGLTITYIEDGSNAFRSIKKSYGMFKNVRSLLLMKGKKADKNLYEKVGYYGEEIILKLTELGYGSCWVGGTFDKEQFSCDPSEEITCVIVIGKIHPITLKESLMRAAISKKRKPIRERLQTNVEAPQWLVEAMKAVQLAPSAINSQKPVFHYDGKIVTASVKEDYAMDLIDLGIAKRHFAIEANGQFTLGNPGTFMKEGE